MSQLTDDLLKILGGFVAFIALIVLGAVTGGFVLRSLWGWFIVPVFSLPALSIAQAIGVSYVVRMIVPSKSSATEKSEKPWQGFITTVFGLPLAILLFGWVLHLFI